MACNNPKCRCTNCTNDNCQCDGTNDNCQCDGTKKCTCSPKIGTCCCKKNKKN